MTWIIKTVCIINKHSFICTYLCHLKPSTMVSRSNYGRRMILGTNASKFCRGFKILIFFNSHRFKLRSFFYHKTIVQITTTLTQNQVVRIPRNKKERLSYDHFHITLMINQEDRQHITLNVHGLSPVHSKFLFFPHPPTITLECRFYKDRF
jgi:hypothetical protein